MINPEYVKVREKKYKINTSFRVALKCNEISKDNSIGNFEKMLSIIYLLFGDKALEDKENYDKLFKLAFDYLNCGNKIDEDDDGEPDMDFIQDYNLIKASLKSDYGIDIDKEDLHWWDFYIYVNGLTDNCILNRIRELRTYDVNEIKDKKEKERILKAKKKFALKEDVKLTKKQKESVDKFYELARIKRK